MGGTTGNVRNYNFANGALPSNFTFSRSSAANYFNSAGVIASASNDVPRFDYNPATLAARGLLIEPARTNIALQSNAFQTLPWSNSVTLGFTTSQTNPLTGLSDAWSIREAASTASHGDAQAISVTNGLTYTISVYVKDNTRRYYQLWFGGTGFGITQYANYDLQSGVLGTVGAAATATITSVGNGWYRLTCTATATSTQAAANFGYDLIQSATSARLESYLGDGVKAVFMYGYQVEQASTASSYVATTNSSASRSADAASLTLPYNNNRIVYTFDDGSTQTVSGVSGTYAIPTSLNRAWVNKMTVSKI